MNGEGDETQFPPRVLKGSKLGYALSLPLVVIATVVTAMIGFGEPEEDSSGFVLIWSFFFLFITVNTLIALVMPWRITVDAQGWEFRHRWWRAHALWIDTHEFTVVRVRDNRRSIFGKDSVYARYSPLGPDPVDVHWWNDHRLGQHRLNGDYEAMTEVQLAELLNGYRAHYRQRRSKISAGPSQAL